MHGDYHLGQVMQTDTGWYVLDFEGEPARPLVGADRMAMSPLKDVSSMLRSFDYAARYVLTERSPAELAKLEPLAEAWETHNRQAFLEGYRDVAGDRGAAGRARSRRRRCCSPTSWTRRSTSSTTSGPTGPEWVPLPLGAIDRLVDGARMSGRPAHDDLELIARGHHGDPHRVLGRHGGVVRAYRPDAVAMRLVTDVAGQEQLSRDDPGPSGRHLRRLDRRERWSATSWKRPIRRATAS